MWQISRLLTCCCPLPRLLTAWSSILLLVFGSESGRATVNIHSHMMGIPSSDGMLGKQERVHLKAMSAFSLATIKQLSCLWVRRRLSA